MLVSFASAKDYLLDAGDSVTVDGSRLTLQNVGSGGAIVVDVDGTIQTISAETTKTIDNLIVNNAETFYADAKEERSARLDISFVDASGLCANGVKDPRTEEAGIDCEGYCGGICPTCSDEIKNQDETDIDCGGDICDKCREKKKCIHNKDCISKDCSDRDYCCAIVSEPFCAGGNLIDKGEKSDGCSLGFSCCGDGICDGLETDENCAIDCCQGCLTTERNCLDIGEKLEIWYCPKNKTLSVQKSETDSCLYDYECLSDLCLLGNCKDINKTEEKFNDTAEKSQNQKDKQTKDKVNQEIKQEVKEQTKEVKETVKQEEQKTEAKKENKTEYKGILRTLFGWFVSIF